MTTKPKQKGRPAREWEWDERRTLAAQLIASGGKTEPEMSVEVGVTRKTLWDWGKRPEFKARIAEIVAETAERLKGTGIREKENRLNALQRGVDRMLGLIEARGKEMAGEVAGGETGILARDYKGKNADRPVYKVENMLLKELREYLKQAAIEVGEWTEKREHKVETVTPITHIEPVEPNGAN